MGQQQILLIVLAIILVGIAILTGLFIFKAQVRSSNIDALITDLNNLGAMAYQFRIRYSSTGGSENSYLGFNEYFNSLPSGMRVNYTGQYTIPHLEEDFVILQGTSFSQQEGDESLKRWLKVDAEGNFEVFSRDPLED